MAYSNIEYLQIPEAAAITTASDVLLDFCPRRPVKILGYGIATIGAFTAGTGAVGGAIQLQKNDAAQDTLTLPNANHAAGKVWERSELLRGRSGVSSPEAAIAAVDVAAGDRIRLVVSTAQAAGTGGTAGSYVPYLIIARQGS